MIMKVLEGDDEAQKCGVTEIVYNVGVGQTAGSESIDQSLLCGSNYDHRVPYRIACTHLCHNDNHRRQAIEAHCESSNRPNLHLHVGKQNRHLFLRFEQKMERRSNFIKSSCAGSHFECQERLRSLGIAMDVFPVSRSGAVCNHRHLEVVQGFERTEIKNSIAKHATGFICPTSDDILLGRGRSLQNFPGNKNLSRIIKSYFPSFVKANKRGKTRIAVEVVEYVQTQIGARFLRRKDTNPDLWEEVNNAVARSKVAHDFRNKLSADKSKQQTEKNATSKV